MPKVHISQEVYDTIQAHKHDGQSITGFLREILRKRYNSNLQRNDKGQFITDTEPVGNKGGLHEQ